MNKIKLLIVTSTDGKVTLGFSDTKRTCTIDVNGLTTKEKIARIRAQILTEGYFYSKSMEKELYKKFK